MDSAVSEHCANRFSKEIGVFEEYEQSEVENERQENECLCQCTTFLHSSDGSGYVKVAHGDKGEEPEEHAAALIIEIVGEKCDEKYAYGVGTT